MIIKNKKAFTLVELIITIIILAILGTIAFISFQNYSKNSRDSVRVSDISKIKTSLELFVIDSSKYPEPSNPFNVTYSGANIWSQGSFGDSVFVNIERLNKIPTDPLTETEFTYSVTTDKRDYEIGGIIESDNLASLSIINNSYALSNITAQSLIVGSYNGSIFKFLSGTTCDVLTIPTIITTHLDSDTTLNTIISEKKFAYNGSTNLPGTFVSNSFASGSFDFVPNKLVAYSDNSSCKELSINQDKRLELYNNVILSYTGTLLNNIVADNSLPLNCTPNERELILSKYLVVNNLGLDVIGGENVVCVPITDEEPDKPEEPEEPENPVPPVILASGPSGTITSSGTTLTVQTDKVSICKYDSSNVSYDLMDNTFITSSSTEHESPYFATVGENSLFVICKDSSNLLSNTANITFNYEYSQPVIVDLSPGDGGTYTCDSCN